RLVSRVAVPVQLHERDACLDQPPGEQTTLPELVPAVAVAYRRRLAAEVERRADTVAGDQGKGFRGKAIIAGLHRAALRCVEAAADRIEQPVPPAQPRQGDIRRHRQLANGEVCGGRIAAHAPRLRVRAEEARILTRVEGDI